MGWRHEPQTREHRIASYNKGCRCDQCKDASRLARKRYRDKKALNRRTKNIHYNEEILF
jgi:hypothetical protein